jgi:hypothetical protein
MSRATLPQTPPIRLFTYILVLCSTHLKQLLLDHFRGHITRVCCIWGNKCVDRHRNLMCPHMGGGGCVDVG